MTSYLRETLAVTRAELTKVFRAPTEVLSRATQPVLWLVVFGQVMAHVRGIDTGQTGYLAFLTPGILAQSVMFGAIFYGISVIWERDLGIIHKLLVSPASRASLVVGKALSSGVRSIVQGAGLFATFSLIIACLVRTRERFMAIGQLLTMPMFFASNAIYPLDLMPGWLKVIAHINPLTYLVDVLRGLMIAGGHNVYGYVVDFSVLSLALVILVAMATRLYPSLAQ